MPTLTERKVWKPSPKGGSHVVTLPPGWLRWATKKAGVDSPADLKVEIIGDTTLTIRLLEPLKEEKNDESS